jgi:hypothetical protein
MANNIDLNFASSRFRGHVKSLTALWLAFHERPRTALTAAELVDITGLSFEDVHARLTRTPELFLKLPPKPKSNTRYRLAMRVEHLTPEALDNYVRSAERSETRIVFAFAAAFIGLVGMLAVVVELSVRS